MHALFCFVRFCHRCVMLRMLRWLPVCKAHTHKKNDNHKPWVCRSARVCTSLHVCRHRCIAVRPFPQLAVGKTKVAKHIAISHQKPRWRQKQDIQNKQDKHNILLDGHAELLLPLHMHLHKRYWPPVVRSLLMHVWQRASFAALPMDINVYNTNICGVFVCCVCQAVCTAMLADEIERGSCSARYIESHYNNIQI